MQSVAAVTQQLEALRTEALAVREERDAAVAGRAEAERQAAALTAQLEAMEAEGAGGPSGRGLISLFGPSFLRCLNFLRGFPVQQLGLVASGQSQMGGKVQEGLECGRKRPTSERDVVGPPFTILRPSRSHHKCDSLCSLVQGIEVGQDPATILRVYWR